MTLPPAICCVGRGTESSRSSRSAGRGDTGTISAVHWECQPESAYPPFTRRNSQALTDHRDRRFDARARSLPEAAALRKLSDESQKAGFLHAPVAAEDGREFRHLLAIAVFLERLAGRSPPKYCRYLAGSCSDRKKDRAQAWAYAPAGALAKMSSELPTKLCSTATATRDELAKSFQLAAMDAILEAGIVAWIPHPRGLEEHGESFTCPAWRRRRATVDARVESHLVRGFVDDGLGIDVPVIVGRVSLGDIVENDTIGARRVVAENPRRDPASRQTAVFQKLLAGMQDCGDQGELRLGGLHSTGAEMVGERPIQRVESLCPAVLLTGWMDHQIAAGSGDFKLAAELPLQLSPHFALRPGTEAGETS